MAPVMAPSTCATRACNPAMLVSELSACDVDRMPSRSMVPVLTLPLPRESSGDRVLRCAAAVSWCGGRLG